MRTRKCLYKGQRESVLLFFSNHGWPEAVLQMVVARTHTAEFVRSKFRDGCNVLFDLIATLIPTVGV